MNAEREQPVVPFRNWIAFYAIQFFYGAVISVFLAFVLIPHFLNLVRALLYAVFVERRFDVFVFLVCFAGVLCYLFRINDEDYTDDYIADESPPHPPLFPPYDSPHYPPPSDPLLYPSYHPPSPWFPPSETSFEPASSHPASDASFPRSTLSPRDSPVSSPPPSAGASSASSALSLRDTIVSSPPPSSPAASASSALSRQDIPVSSPPPSSPAASYASSSRFSASSPRDTPVSSPPRPPFRMRPWKLIIKGDYARIASDVILSSDGDSDIDDKSTEFITQFRNRLKFEER